MQLVDRYLIARCLYARGINYISDAEYDEIARELQNQGYEFSPIYEDDSIPYEAFFRVLGKTQQEVDTWLGVEDQEQVTSLFQNEEDVDFLRESDMLSIHSVTEFKDAFSWFCEMQGVDVLISTKIDGINTRRGYKNTDNYLNYNAAITRGRRSDPINITANLRNISPTGIKVPFSTDLLVYSETIVPFEAIDYINDKYSDTYAIPRNLAMAMMRVDRFDKEDFKYLKSYVFRVEYGNTLSEGIDLAESLGFDVVPYIHYTYNGESFEEFCEEMESNIRFLKSKADEMHIITDGMVAEVNDRNFFSSSEIKNSYSSANIALKIGLWQPGVYESTVIDLEFAQQNDRCACVAIIEPVTAKGGQKISRVNCFNPSVLFNHDIRPGKRIRFEYKNETTVDIILSPWG